MSVSLEDEYCIIVNWTSDVCFSDAGGRWLCQGCECQAKNDGYKHVENIFYIYVDIYVYVDIDIST